MHTIIQINSNVYCNFNSNEILLFNFNNGHFYVFNIENYTVQFNNNILIIGNSTPSDNNVSKLINYLEKHHMGLLREESEVFFSTNYFQILSETYKEERREEKYFYNDSLFNTLSTITICLNEVSHFYKNTRILSKQIDYLSNYKIKNKSLLINNIKPLFDRLEKNEDIRINLSGSNLITNNNNRETICYLLRKFKVRIFIHIKELLFDIKEVIIHPNLTYVLIVESNNINLMNKKVADELKEINYHTNIFISNFSDINNVKYSTFKNINLYPVYINNEHFLEEIFSYSINDLENVNYSKNKICRNSFVNELLFGKLTIHNDGNVYSNIQDNSIGNIFHTSIDDILYSVNNDSKSWLYTRSLFPLCEKCIFNCICQPLSYYEMLLNKTFCDKNICMINKV